MYDIEKGFTEEPTSGRRSLDENKNLSITFPTGGEMRIQGSAQNEELSRPLTVSSFFNLHFRSWVCNLRRSCSSSLGGVERVLGSQ